MDRRSFLKAVTAVPVAAAGVSAAAAMGPQKFQHKGILHSVDFTEQELEDKPEWCAEQMGQMHRAFFAEIDEYREQGKIIWKKQPEMICFQNYDAHARTYEWSAQFHVV